MTRPHITRPRNIANRNPVKTALALVLALGGTALVAAAAAADAPTPPVAAAAEADAAHHRGDRGAHRRHGPREVDLAEAEQRAKAAFDRVDSNDDDRISPAEIAAAGPRAFGPMGMGGRHGRHHGRHHGPQGAPDQARPVQAEALGAVFQRLDANGDGQLSASEFAGVRAAQREERQARHFTRMDADGNGSLSRTEFPPMLAHLRTLDANKDGKVTRDEFPQRHGRHGNRDGRPGDAAPRG
jgi:hypothetical protein